MLYHDFEIVEKIQVIIERQKTCQFKKKVNE